MDKIKTIRLICGAIIVVGFFLPWMDMGEMGEMMSGFAAMTGEEFSSTFSGYQLAIGGKENPGGEEENEGMNSPTYKEAKREEVHFDRGEEEQHVQCSIVGEEGGLTGESSEETLLLIRRKGDEKEEVVRKETILEKGVPKAQDRPPEIPLSSSHARKDGGSSSSHHQQHEARKSSIIIKLHQESSSET